MAVDVPGMEDLDPIRRKRFEAAARARAFRGHRRAADEESDNEDPGNAPKCPD